MSRRADITWDIVRFCAERELPQDEVVNLVYDVLSSAGQIYNDNDESMKEEKESISKNVEIIYAKVLEYESNFKNSKENS